MRDPDVSIHRLCKEFAHIYRIVGRIAVANLSRYCVYRSDYGALFLYWFTAV